MIIIMSFCPNCGNPIYGNCCTRCGFGGRPIEPRRQLHGACGGTGVVYVDIFGFPCPPGPQAAQRRRCSGCNGTGYV